jgi:hypothetical protein
VSDRVLTGIVSNNHALLVGNVVGALMRMTDDLDDMVGPTTVDPVLTDDGDYTNQILVHRPSGTYRISVEFDEPDDADDG